MYFFFRGGKQVVDFTGDLILTHNDDLIKTRTKSAAPRQAKKAKYIPNITQLGVIGKIRATFIAIGFIWGPSQALTPDELETNYENPGQRIAVNGTHAASR